MKKASILFLLASLAAAVQAEMLQYYFKVKIETRDGQVHRGFMSAPYDDLSEQKIRRLKADREFLLREISERVTFPAAVRVFDDLVEYRFLEQGQTWNCAYIDEEKSREIGIAGIREILLERVVELVPGIRVLSEIAGADTWIRSPAKSLVLAEGDSDLCGTRLFDHGGPEMPVALLGRVREILRKENYGDPLLRSLRKYRRVLVQICDN